MAIAQLERVTAYVDGFNLYHGLNEAYAKKYMWLDPHLLVESLLRPNQELGKTNFYTARVRGAPASSARQTTYIDALRARGIDVHEGRYQLKHLKCPSCRHRYTKYEEKETDVNLAVQMVVDAHLDTFDLAFLISADADLCAAVRAVRQLGKRVVIAEPPRRSSDALQHTANAYMKIYKSRIVGAQLPDPIQLVNGHKLHRPPEWN